MKMTIKLDDNTVEDLIRRHVATLVNIPLEDFEVEVRREYGYSLDVRVEVNQIEPKDEEVIALQAKVAA